MSAGALSMDSEDEHRCTRGRDVRSISFQTPGVIHGVTLLDALGDGGRGEQASEKKLDKEKPRGQRHHKGETAGHKQIREQCGTLVPLGQTALLERVRDIEVKIKPPVVPPNSPQSER